MKAEFIAAFIATAALTAIAADAAWWLADDALIARAALENSSGVSVGSAYFRETPTGVLLRVELTGVTPGTHAMHIHAKGDCQRPTFESASGHLALPGQAHGFLDARGPHAGDLPNIHIGTGGLTIEVFLKDVTLRPGERTLLDADGAALVIHQGPDDYRTNPAGNAGDRLVCGAITR